MSGITFTKQNPRYTPPSSINRADLVQDDAKEYNIDILSECRKADSSALPTSPDGTNLGIIGGTFGTNSPILEGTDSDGSGAATQSELTRLFFTLPAEYQAGQTITVRIHSRVDVVRHTAATVDVICYLADKEAGIGSDLCTTGAISNNSASWADQDFTIDPTGLVAGDILDIEVIGATDDTNAGTGSAGHVEIGAIQVLLDVKG